MSTTVSDFIADLAENTPHPYTNSKVLSWINRVESDVYADTFKIYAVQYYSRQQYVDEFSLPSGAIFEDIKNVYVSGCAYRKYDVRSHNIDKSFYYDGGKIKIYPVPDTDDVEYVSGTSEITFASGTITTTGDDFSGFKVGDIVQISGCVLDTGNNKYARIAGVALKVLTFADGTFTAQEETAAITITAPKVKIVYQVQPTKKLIANISTDTLLIPDRFNDIYEYYCMAQIAYLREENGQYNNHMAMFNRRVTEYKEWYDDNRPITPESDILADDGWTAAESNDFDTT